MRTAVKKTIGIEYFAILREQSGLSEEQIETSAETPAELYEALKKQHDFHLETGQLRVSVNHQFCNWDQPLKSGDHVVFIPPVAGG